MYERFNADKFLKPIVRANQAKVFMHNVVNLSKSKVGPKALKFFRAK